MLNISDNAKEIINNKPFLWEFRLYAQIVKDEIEFNIQKILTIKPDRHHSSELNISTFPSLVMNKFEDFQNSLFEFKELTDANHDDAFGPPGNIENIISFARKIASFHFNLVMALHTVKNASIDHRCSEIVSEFYKLIHPSIRFLENYGINLLNQIILKESAKGPIYIDGFFEIGFNLDDENRFSEAIIRYCKQLKNHTAKDQISNNDAGFIYLLINASMAGLVKLGKTTRNPHERAKEIGAVTGVPFPFEVIFEAYVNNCTKAERYVHQRLSHARVKTNKEFFKVNSTEAIRVMIEAEKIYKPSLVSG